MKRPHHKQILWSDRLAIDNGMIDDDHRYLIELTNQFLLMGQYFDSVEQALETIGELRAYASAHFRREEALQEQVNYPAAAKHKKAHLEMERSLATMDNVIRNTETQDLDKVAADVANLLREWLVSHILKEDMLMRNYVMNMRVQSTNVVPLREVAFV